MYMNEFGFNNFEMLIIKKTKKYIVVITLGLLEFCAGVVLLKFSANPLIFILARYLIRAGIKDVIKRVKATTECEEIDLQTFGIEKSVSITFYAINLVIGKEITLIEDRFKNKLLSIIKEECFSLVINYGNRFIANKLLKNIISQLTEKIKENLMDNVMNIIELNGDNIDKYIQYDK